MTLTFETCNMCGGEGKVATEAEIDQPIRCQRCEGAGTVPIARIQITPEERFVVRQNNFEDVSLGIEERCGCQADTPEERALYLLEDGKTCRYAETRGENHLWHAPEDQGTGIPIKLVPELIDALYEVSGIERPVVANITSEEAIRGVTDFGLKALSGFFGAVAGRVARDGRQAELERLHSVAFDLLSDLRMASADGRKEAVPCIDRVKAWLDAEKLRRSKEPPPPNARVADQVSDQEGSKSPEKP